MLPGGVFLRLAFVAVTVLASINGPCTIGEQAGTCVATADCTAKGGSFQDNFCPDDPDDIKCCVGCDTSSTASNTASTSSNTAASSDSVDTSLVNASNNAGGGAPSLSNAYSSSTTPPTLTLTSSNQGYPDVASQPALSGSVVQAPTSPGYPDVASQSPPSPPAMFPNQGQASSPTSGQNSDNSGSGSGSGSGAAHPAPSRYGDLSASGNRNNRPAPSHYGDLSGFNRAGGAPGGLPGLSGQIGPGQFPPVYGRPNGGQTASACHFVTPAAKALVKAKEGFESSNPDDGFGNPTCGFGHLCIKKGCAEIQPHFTLPLTKASASKLLDMDLYKVRTSQLPRFLALSTYYT